MTDYSSYTPQQAADPRLAPQAMADIAAHRPDLHVALASNPALYPDLASWLERLGNPQITQALHARGGAAGASGNAAPGSYGSPGAYGSPNGYAAPVAGPVAASAPGIAAAPAPAPTSAPGAPVAPRRRLPSRTRRAIGLTIAAGLVAILAIGGGGAFALWALVLRGGASSPEALGNGLMSGIAGKDLLSISRLASPAEKEYSAQIRSGAETLVPDGGVGDVGPQDIQQVLDAIEIDSDLSTEVVEENENLAVLEIADGSATASWDREEMAEALQNLYQKATGKELSRSEERNLQDALERADDHATWRADDAGDMVGDRDARIRLVGVKEGGRWYLSPMLTYVELFSLIGGSHPDYDADWVADSAGSDSPTAAVQDMGDGLLEARSVQDLVSPEVTGHLTLVERRLAQVYGAPLAEDAGDSRGEESIGDTVSIQWGLKESGTQIDGLKIVTPGTTVIDVVPDAGSGATYTFSDQCLEIAADDYSDERCWKDDLKDPDLVGIATVQEDDGWHVSLGGTLGTALRLRASDEALDRMEQEGGVSWEDMEDQLSGSVSEETLTELKGLVGVGFLASEWGQWMGEMTGSDVDYSGDGYTSGTGMDLGDLRDACTGGDDEACNNLYYYAPIGSEDETFGATCAGRVPTGTGGTC